MPNFKTSLYIILSVLALCASASPNLAAPKDTAMTAHDFSFQGLDGTDTIDMASHKGSVVLVVNTASKCGFTEQYDGLQNLYDQFKGSGLVVLGVPSNDFGGQEPGNEKTIKEFCAMRFGINFPMTGKTIVTGKDAHPFYQWAAKHSVAPKWNFHKYLIAKDGRLVDWYASTTKPTSSKITKKIEALLQE